MHLKHADKCLAQQASSRGRNQSTLASFASREKRAKLAKSDSASALDGDPPQDDTPTAASDSPKRKKAGSSSPLRTRQVPEA